MRERDPERGSIVAIIFQYDKLSIKITGNGTKTKNFLLYS